jgi:hypothetical protein
MRKQTCGQCTNDSGLQDSSFPIRCRTGRVKLIGMLLCTTCRDQARRVIARAVRLGRLAI